MPTSAASATDQGVHPYAEPSPAYLRQFVDNGTKVLVLERFDADGKLAARSVEPVSGEVVIDGAVERRIAGHRIRLRGLTSCPTPSVTYNRVQRWSCVDAARDYAGTIYNKRASVILCKTAVLTSAEGEAIPASCFQLVGGHGEPYRTANDDDSMVFLGLAAIGTLPDGRPRRPDLERSQALSHTMGSQDAD
jgi:hypothetical protein